VITLEGRTAIVTGAGSGLGRSHAKALARRGAKVLVNDLGADVDGSGKDSGPADAVADEIREVGGTAVADHTSVATPEGGAAIVEHAIDEFGGLDILVNNAGNITISSFARVDVSTIDQILDVHLGGAFYVTQPAYRAMLPQKRGRIIFTVGGVATFGNLGAGTYAAAKGGIIGLLNTLKLEAARHGDILVNAIAPMAQTRMATDVALSEYVELTERSVSPDLVSPVVEYFASDECTLSGELWSVGAGSVARQYVSRTRGYFKHPERDGELTAEDVAGNVEVIRDPEGATVPASWPAEWQLIVDLFRAGAT
jgi:NAD(P)-dependent dehydrogenase (short-subunit alcohol dehydrogenase family)